MPLRPAQYRHGQRGKGISVLCHTVYPTGLASFLTSTATQEEVGLWSQVRRTTEDGVRESTEGSFLIVRIFQREEPNQIEEAVWIEEKDKTEGSV